MKMKWTSYLLSAAASAVLMLAFASAAHAQNWQDADFNKFLSNHPGVASQLRANPNLINDPAFRHAHPDLQEYLQNHQRVSAMVRGQATMMNGQWGAYDQHNQWHNQQWWTQNNPGWVQQYHPEWMSGGHPGYPPPGGYPAYAGNPAYNPADGAWDPHHHWRGREWWLKHDPDWVKANHPEWWANHH
jgi:hypothetical protein